MMEYQEQLRLQAYLDGELSEAERREISERLVRDPEAAALLGELRRTGEALAGFEETLKLPESREFYWSKIEREIQCQKLQPEPATALSWVSALRRFLVPAASVAVLLIAGLLINVRQSATLPNATALDDTGAITYHDYAAGVTVVWLSYPVEKEFAGEEELAKLE